MTTNSHSRGSGKSHSRGHKKEDAKINGTINDDVMLQQCYKEIALLEYWLENPGYDREVFMKDSHEAEDGKKVRLADSLMVNTNQHAKILPEKAEEKASENFLDPEKDLELQKNQLVTEATNETSGSCDFNANNLMVFTGDEPKDVAEGQEAWEATTSMAAPKAASMVAAELTEIGNNSSKLDIEIEEIWQLMMQQSKWRKIEIAASKINQNLNLIDRKKKMEERTTKMQRQQRNKAFGWLQNKVWDPGRSRPQTT